MKQAATVTTTVDGMTNTVTRALPEDTVTANPGTRNIGTRWCQ